MAYLAKTTSKGRDYYKIMESYREDGKTRHRVVQNIGTLSQLFELLQTAGIGQEKTEARRDPCEIQVELGPVRCRTHGDSFLLYSVARWIGIREIMDLVFAPKTAQSIDGSLSLLLVAIHRACDPGREAGFEDWFARTSLPDYLSVDPELFTPEHFVEQMDGISREDIGRFETRVCERIWQLLPEARELIDARWLHLGKAGRGREEQGTVHIFLCALGLLLCRVAQYLLKKKEGYEITCTELLHRLSHVQECRVSMTVDGRQMERKTVGELYGVDRETWEVASRVLKDIEETQGNRFQR